jgi:RNA polymerase sigma-70 factor, ECF subfamily
MPPTVAAVVERRVLRSASNEARLENAVSAYYPAVCRSVRRLGASDADAHDIAQEAFLVFSRRVGEVDPENDKRFLFRTAFRLLARDRRRFIRRREDVDEAIERHGDPAPTPEEQTDELQRRAALDRLLSQLPFELRVILTLAVIEQMKLREVAEILDLPMGTVASRVARARERMAEFVRCEWARRER